MKFITYSLIFCFFGPFLFGQDFIELYADEELLPGMERKDPVSKTRDEVTRLSNVVNPRLQVFRPEQRIDNGRAVIVCPGGGYHILAIDLEGIEIADWLTSLGYTAYILEYSVPEKRMRALEDLQRAIKLIRASSPTYSKLGVLGFSAGGHLAAWGSASMLESEDMQEIAPDFTVLIYPAYLDQGGDGGVSPEINLSGRTVPTFISVSADDQHANSSLIFSQALQKNGTPVELHMFPEGGHGYGMRSERGDAASTWPLLCEKWLKKQ